MRDTSRDELISDVLLWTSSRGRIKAGWHARTYIHQPCAYTGCSPEDLPEAMDDRDWWQEKFRNICVNSATWWWWWWWYFRLILLSISFTTFIFLKLIMADSALTNEMKRHALIVVLKAHHGDLEIVRCLRVAISFVHKIRKELEKEIDNVTFISKRKNVFHTFRFNENTEFIIKLSRQLMKIEINRWDQLQKSCICLKRQSEGVFMKTFDTNPTRWREVNLFLKNQKKTA